MPEPTKAPAQEKRGDKKLDVTATYEELEAAIPEVAAMKGLDQRSDFHTLTLDEHTKKLVQTLEADPYVQGLDEQVRNLLLLAGKLHDLGKTSEEGAQVHPKDPEKRRYVGHEAESKRMVREVLPQHFDLTESEQNFIARLAGLHASALTLVDNFQRNKEPNGKALKSYDKLITRVSHLPGDLSLEEKMRIVFALNTADKSGGWNEQSDSNDEKVQAVKAKAEAQIAVLEELKKALPALLAAIEGRRGGDQNAGIKLVDGKYVYEPPKKKAEKKVQIPPELRSLGGVLQAKVKDVAPIYPRLKKLKAAGNDGAVNGIVNGQLKGRLGLDDAQVQAILDTLE